MSGKLIKSLFIILLSVFAVIFVLRFIYELSYYWGTGRSFSYYDYGYDSYISSYSGSFYDSSVKSSTRNIATANQLISGDKGVELNYDQKYEMISNITSNSEDFDNDVSKVRKAVDNVSGVIQMEYTAGLEDNNNRMLWISVGVTPGKFDSLVDELKLIGALTGFSVNKTDKTAEFNSYLAQREALEKTLESYNALKTQGGAIADLLIVEEKIIQTEKEILEMGVTLGLFDENQSLCTVDFTLSEYRYAEQQRGGIEFYMIIDSAFSALGWTLTVYFVGILFVIFTGFSALGGAFIISRITKYSVKNTESIKSDGNVKNDSQEK